MEMVDDCIEDGCGTSLGRSLPSMIFEPALDLDAPLRSSQVQVMVKLPLHGSAFAEDLRQLCDVPSALR
jgi:hypothetical protein